MSTAVAAAPGALGHHLDHNPSTRSYPPLAPSTAAPSIERPADDAPMRVSERTAPDAARRSPRPYAASKPEDEAALTLDRLRSGVHPKIVLDLNTNTASLAGPNSTQDPTMREQLQRSLSVRDQQRSIIESRLLKSAKGDVMPDSAKATDCLGAAKTSSGGCKKRPPAGLSIVPPAAERFANERVVQSAPLNHSFPGRSDAQPPSRNPSGPNRLPPISDVFAPNELRPEPTRPSFLHTVSSSSQHGPPLPSPGYPPQTAHPMSQSAYGFPDRPREYRSAEEAVHDLTGGREELMPKIKALLNGLAGRRRSRNEYEDGSTPPLGSGRTRRPHYPFGDERDSPATNRAKKDKFLALCAEAWDLFHS
ncbi:hypothetical protein DV737_g312, partial [Chaetothyriales sp. CBS 132003]